MSENIFIPDYSTYTLEELENIHSRIQKDKFLERVEAIEKEINYRRSQIKEPEEDQLHKQPGKERYQLIIDKMDITDQEKSFPNLIVLVLTLMLFFTSGLFFHSFADVLLLIAVMLIHEAGHLLIMRITGYKDLKMFFIPLMGAAVTGKNEKQTGLSAALVALAGPLPGIIIGLFILMSGTTNGILQSYAKISLFLNIFNLLPIFPLDGGKFLFYNLLCRNSKLEISFLLISHLLLLIISIALHSVFLGIIAVINLLLLSKTIREWKIVNQFKETVIENNYVTFNETPADFKRNFVESVCDVFPKITDDKTIAKAVNNTWQRTKLKAPNLILSIALTLLYISLFILIIYVQRGNYHL